MIFSSPSSNARLLRAYDLISDKLALVEEELLLHFRSPIPTIDRIGGQRRFDFDDRRLRYGEVGGFRDTA